MFFLITLISLLISVLEASINTTDTLTPTHSLSFDRSLVSAAGQFQLSFFISNGGYYLGIRYKDIPTNDVLWVANRDSPSPNSSSTFHLSSTGNLFILHAGELLWSSNQSTSALDPVVQILDSGNLVVREADDSDPDHYLWQSFNNPTDTLVPGQKLEFNPILGVGRQFTSWVGPDDPGSGDFAFAADNSSRLDFYLAGERNEVVYQTPVVQDWAHDPMVEGVDSTFFNITYYVSPSEVYYVLQQPPPPNSRVKLRIMVTYEGLIRELMWDMNPNTTQWRVLWSTGSCGCGPYGVCSSNGKVCECPRGFEPVDAEGWRVGRWSGGCARIDNLVCQSDGFLQVENVKVLEQKPKANFVNESMDIEQCGELCKRDCNCIAYANSQILNKGNGSGGCITWVSNVTDVRNFTQGGQVLYVRVAASVLGKATWWTHLHIVLVIVIPLLIIGTMLLAIFIWIRVYKNRQGRRQTPNLEINEIKSVESLQMDLSTIRAATRNFSLDNKLGEGGFGEVYKGKFENGQEIAVKRLSESSTQGALEFKTEVLLVAKLQHKNLVKLLGFCLASKEKILVYEYLQNSSLDKILFDPAKKLSLNWHSRFKIIVGIARGLMYLHVDSRLKVIHRDLKISNILLDENMNPKISDFGLAKLFENDQTQDATKRIVGTYGYMAPEYAMTGQFSVKSDIYSFGVIILEIISGVKNRHSVWQQVDEALLHRAWRLWKEGNPFDLVDKTLGNDYPEDESIKCIQIGLMCVQEKALARPTIEVVVAALSGEAVTLPVPNAPNFFASTSASTDITHSGTNPILTTRHGTSIN